MGRVRRGFVLLIGVALIHTAAVAVPSVPPFGVYDGATYSPTITVLESGPSVIRLHLLTENLPSGGTINFNTRFAGLWGEMNQIGVLLPRFTIFLALPNTGTPTVSIESWTGRTFDAVPANLPENNPQPDTIRLDHVGILGGVRVVPVTFRPVRYQNGANTCSILLEATVRIDIDGQPGENPVTTPRTSFSRPWQKIFQALITNWEYIPNFYTATASHILMIIPDSYVAGCQDFVRWKEQRGTYVTVVRRSAIGNPPSAQQIRSRIITEVDASNPRIDHVILVGDETQLVPTWLHTNDPYTRFNDFSLAGNYTNEAYFACLEGTDVFPDVFLGRWVVNSDLEARKIVKKTILHERDTFSGDSTRFQRSMTASDNTEVSQRLTKQYVKRMLLGEGFARVDTLWGSGSPQPVIDAVDRGLTFLNYRGSGWNEGWAGVRFYTGDIYDLQNVRKLPIVTGIGCGVAKFDVQDNYCFGEVWMLVGTLNDPKGSAGFIGPCWNTHTVYNDVLDSLLYRSILTCDVLSLGPALAAGKMMAWGTFGQFLNDEAVLEVTSTMMRQYLLLCDPSLQVFTQLPVRLEASVPDAVPGGPYNLIVNVANMASVPAESLQVTAWLTDASFVTRWITPDRSTATLPIDASGRDTILVTITGDNALAYQKRLTVGSEGPYLVHLASLLDDTLGGNGNGLLEPGESIDWYERLWNIGSQEAQEVVATLSSVSPAVTVTQPTVSLGTIPAGDSVTAAVPFAFSIGDSVGTALELPFHLSWTIQNGPTQAVDLSLPLHVPVVELANFQIFDINNGIWDRGETVSFHVSVANNGSADLVPGVARLTTTDPYVTILRGQLNTPVIPAGQSYDFPSGALRAQSSWQTPAGHQTQLTLEISADMGMYTYVVRYPIELTISPVGPHDPFADTDEHYWIYDNTDSAYTERPSFEWIEIAPAAGGSGTVIAVPRSDYTLPVEVPFDFTFYGVSYDTLSISTDGWVHPGRTTATAFGGQRLPAPGDNLAGMIAALWFDLWWQQIGSETGQLCYYYDQTTDRFIVEWYQIHDWRTGTFQETFQLQLLNPDTYPTETGDAAWLLLYSEVSSHPFDPGEGASLGIESPNQESGASYFYRGEYARAAAPLVAGRAIKITPNSPAYTPVAEVKRGALPTRLELAQNYPNPFNPETVIEFALPWATHATLEVFDILGRRVATLVNSDLPAGVHRVAWLGNSDPGTTVGSGLYFYRLSTPQGVLTRKMILLR